jgi:hypothetical protein
MRILLGIGLMVIGGSVMLYGGGMAVRELVGMYGAALNTPMEDPKGGEQAVSDRMLTNVKIGAVGALPFVVGVAIFKGGLVRRALRSRRV